MVAVEVPTSYEALRVFGEALKDIAAGRSANAELRERAP
jgi:hypothetical protein